MWISNIKYNTQTSDFIKIADVEEAVERKTFYYEEQLLEMNDLLEGEMTKGLSEYAFCIEGEIPFYKKAKEIQSRIPALKDAVNKMKEEIINTAKVHLKEEYEKLSSELQKKIDELEAELADLRQKNDILKTKWRNYREDIHDNDYPPYAEDYYEKQIYQTNILLGEYKAYKTQVDIELNAVRKDVS